MSSRPSSGQVPISPRSSRSRAHSISSDRPSNVTHTTIMGPPPTNISPEPCFIAASAACQIVTNDHDSHAQAWYDQNGLEPSDEAALVSTASLHLVNSFLDQLLFNILQVSRSTSLSALRPAVSEVLKPKLAKDTIASADEELREYLGGASEDEYGELEAQSPRSWDLELVWKRIRLRCMVYSSVGDLEEEDEDMYMEEEHLQIGEHEQMEDVISPAAAIFLTSVLEYMGELTLTVAGQAAYNRIRTKLDKELRDGSRHPGDKADQIIVDDMDTERVALDRTLGRLWRGWKKRLRAPSGDFARPYSRQSNSGSHDLTSPRLGSSDMDTDYRQSQDYKRDTIAEHVSPYDVPLPMTDRDVDEIEVPGLVSYSDDEDEQPEEYYSAASRPKSMLVTAAMFKNGLPTPNLTQPSTPVITRVRSNSMPSATRAPLSIVRIPEAEKEDVVDADGAESLEYKDASETVDEQEDDSALPPPIPVKKRATVANSSEMVENDEFDSEIDDVVYEDAEVVTSSRVSVNSTASPARSDGHSHARSISGQSARLITVQAPRSASSSIAGSPARSSVEEQDGAVRPAWSPERLRRVDAEHQQTGDFDAVADERAKQINRVAELTKQFHAAQASDDPADTTPAARSANLAHITTPPNPDDDSSTAKPFNQRKGNLPPTPVEPTDMDGTRKTQPRSPRPAQGLGLSDKSVPLTLEQLRAQEMEEDLQPPQKSIHAASGSISSLSSRFRPVRTSDDHSSTSRSESVARNLEELIQSNQTITYTLTPETMRNLESPIVAQFPTMGEDAAPRSPVLQRPSPSQEGAESPSTMRMRAMAAPIMEEESQPPLNGPVPRAPTGLAISTGRLGGPQAREARTPNESSTADFAAFIRSTGPASADYRPFPPTRSPVKNPVSPIRPPSSAGNRSETKRMLGTTSPTRHRHEPREATMDGNDDSRDLLDFIRQGPPIATSNNQHRIPRHIAPFRTTMDSEEMSGVAGGRAIDANIPDIRHSQSSTNATEQSVQSSMHSGAALINKSPPSRLNQMFDDEPVMPVRKTRRVRDPYAIDYSDEEEEMMAAQRRQYDIPEETSYAEPRRSAAVLPVRKEESLAEFLRNYDPPAEPVGTTRRAPRKKISAPNLIGRFTRNQVKEPPLPPAAPAVYESRDLHTSGGASTKSTASRYIPIQVSMPPGYGRYGIAEAEPAARGAEPPGTRKVPMKKFVPREAAGSGVSETAELAAFLRNSRPPPSMSPPPRLAPLREEESRGLSKMFGRKKKQAV